MYTVEMVVLTIVLYLIHRSFHKVNFFGFVLISIVLISMYEYMVHYMHVNRLIAMTLLMTLSQSFRPCFTCR
jgi:hypothetical protein